MAYSRWPNSKWYSYPSSSKDFCILPHENSTPVCFSYVQVKQNREEVISDIRRIHQDYSDKEFEELSAYMDQYVIDVESGKFGK